MSVRGKIQSHTHTHTKQAEKREKTKEEREGWTVGGWERHGSWGSEEGERAEKQRWRK